MTQGIGAGRRRAPVWQRALPWLLTAACFAFLYATRLRPAAARQGLTVAAYFAQVFASVRWSEWLPLMIGYSTLFFLVDSAVVWRVVNWFDARVRYVDILPIRASAYILSMLNEQVGKGAMALYLNRRDGVPGWQVGSSMLFIMFCEVYYLLAWGTLGVAVHGSALPAGLRVIPWIFAGALGLLALWIAYFRGAIAPSSQLRERPILHAFRHASWWHYGGIVLLRSPAMLAAVFVYHAALRLFGIHAELLDLLGYLPLVFASAALPLPLRAGPVVLWSLVYPEDQARITTFGLVQHNFFILFNAAIGVLFLRRANRELLGAPAARRPAS